MSIEQIYIDESFNKLEKYFNKTITQNIIDGIINFTIIYIDCNESLFLINDIYNSKVTELLEIIKSSDYIVTSIKNNLINPKELAIMKPYELNPERYKDIIEKKIYEQKNKEQKGASLFSCKKCKQSNCDISQKQTRCADEPTTTFVTCLECGYSFQF